MRGIKATTNDSMVSRCCSVFVAAVAAAGVHALYNHGISRIIEKETKEHSPIDRERLELSWICDSSGLYAAAIHKINNDQRDSNTSFSFEEELVNVRRINENHKKSRLSIIIYDFLRNKSYVYFEELTDKRPIGFYWFNGDIILVYAYKENKTFQQVQMKLDHVQRKAELINIRNYVFPRIVHTHWFVPIIYFPVIEKIWQNMITPIDSIWIQGNEYILLANIVNGRFVLLPKDPNSKLQLRFHAYYYDITDERYFFNGERGMPLEPIPYGQFLYFPKIRNLPDRVVKFCLDVLMELDMNQLENIPSCTLNPSTMEYSPDATKEVFLNHSGETPADVSEPMTVLSSKGMGNGKVLAVVLENNSRRRFCCLIDVASKTITWKLWQPTIQRESNVILPILHPSILHNFVEIDYKRNKKCGNYGHFCKIIGERNRPLKLKTLALFKLFTTECPIPSRYSNMIRRIL